MEVPLMSRTCSICSKEETQVCISHEGDDTHVIGLEHIQRCPVDGCEYEGDMQVHLIQKQGPLMWKARNVGIVAASIFLVLAIPLTSLILCDVLELKWNS